MEEGGRQSMGNNGKLKYGVWGARRDGSGSKMEDEM